MGLKRHAHRPNARGAQNVSEFDAGAHTGEVAPAMLADFGCRYVVVGHSERRSRHHEEPATVARKLRAALAHGRGGAGKLDSWIS